MYTIWEVRNHQPRVERETRFTNLVDEIVSRTCPRTQSEWRAARSDDGGLMMSMGPDLQVSNGGRCLLPVFALGRAQELALILEVDAIY